MFRIQTILVFLAILLLPVFTSACGLLLEPVRTTGEAPTPIVRLEAAGTDDPDVFVEFAPFQAALLEAIQSRDEPRLQRLMAEVFWSGLWQGELSDLPQSEALSALYQDQLGDPNHLALAPDADLSALMGGIDPLAILAPETNVVNAIYVTGWGKDGQDEAILFVSRQPDNALRWAGTLVIQGGFASPETGGAQPLVDAQNGYQLYLPPGYEVQQAAPNEISIFAPQGSAKSHLVHANIAVEPAYGRTVEQIVTELKDTTLSHVAAQPGTVTSLDGETALVFDRVPSQYPMRMLYVVHEDRLYRMIFLPQDEAEGEAYSQMLDLYAVIFDTFRFIPVENAEPASSNGGKLVANPAVFINLLQQGLAQRDKVALQSMMGDTFNLSFWRSEGTQITPDQAIEQILNNYVPDGAQPVLDPNHPVIASLFSGQSMAETGEELIPVHVAGWGLEGQDEAILFIARRADGSLYWQGALTALGGFEQ